MTKKKATVAQVNWEDDKLGIQQHVVGFANILTQEKYVPNGSSKVYSISAEFGVGKTFFCTKLHDVLKQEDIPTSILNIWEMDFYDNPLIPLLIKIKDLYIKYNQLRTTASDAVKFFAKIIKVFTKHQYGIDIDKFIETYQNLKPHKSDIYNNYQEFNQELTKLKKLLSSWTERQNKPVVIIIDELDRCRPDYAVKTLEILKHFFDIPGFVFVLAIDEEQLKSSVETLFGTKNFDGYKRKFINNSFVLPAPDKVKFTDFLYEKSGLANVIQQIEEKNIDLVFKTTLKDIGLRQFHGDQTLQKEREFNKNQTAEKIIKRYFAAYSIWFKFSLRQMEQVCDRFVLFSNNILRRNVLFSPDLAVFLVCLHEFDLQIYNKLRTGSNKVYGQHGGLLKHIYCTSKTENSIARSIYKDDADSMFGDLNRTIIPKVPEILGFSSLGTSEQQSMVVIRDNIDRFFAVEESQKHPLAWIIEIQNHETGTYSMVQNNGRIAVITHSKRDTAWKEPSVDIDTAPQFDLMHFRQVYFDNMDFIANFK